MTNFVTSKRITERAEQLIKKAEIGRERGLNPRFLKRYLVLSTPRTGSSALCSALSHVGLGAPGEWLNSLYINSVKKVLGVTNIRFKDYWDTVLLGASNHENQIFGIKVHIDQYLNIRKKSIDLNLLDWEKVYYVERKDKISQAYSHCKATALGVWSKGASQEAMLQDTYPSISMSAICHSLLKIVSEHEFALSHFSIDEENHFIFEDMIKHGFIGYAQKVSNDFGAFFDCPKSDVSEKQSDSEDLRRIRTIKTMLGAILEPDKSE